MGIYFIFFVIIKCCDCFVAQIVSSLAIGSHAILSWPPFSSLAFLPFCKHTPDSCCIFSALALESSISLEPCCPNWRMVFTAKDLIVGYTCWMYINMCKHTYLQLFLYLCVCKINLSSGWRLLHPVWQHRVCYFPSFSALNFFSVSDKPESHYLHFVYLFFSAPVHTWSTFKMANPISLWEIYLLEYGAHVHFVFYFCC